MDISSLGIFSPTDAVDDTILTAAVQGAFYGSSLPPAQIEGLIAAHIPRKHFKDVSDVYRTRWWDYRRLAPGHSFLLFAHHYYSEGRAAGRRVIATQHNRGVRGGNFGLVGHAMFEGSGENIWTRDQSHITGLWKAMLVADALGIPYPTFLRLSFRIAIDRMWKNLPRPNQLYAETLAPYVMDEWDELVKERLFLPSHPVYKAENYVGTQLQDEYRAWLIPHLRGQKDIVPALMMAIHDRKQLTEADAAPHFSSTLLNRARLLAN